MASSTAFDVCYLETRVWGKDVSGKHGGWQATLNVRASPLSLCLARSLCDPPAQGAHPSPAFRAVTLTVVFYLRVSVVVAELLPPAAMASKPDNNKKSQVRVRPTPTRNPGC